MSPTGAEGELDLGAARESIERSVQAPAPATLGGLRRVLRSYVLRLTRPRALHQLQTDRRLLEAIQSFARTKAARPSIDDLRRWLHNNDVRLRSLERAAEQLTDYVTAAGAAPDPQAVGRERFDAG